MGLMSAVKNAVFGYDATKNTGRRKSPGVSLKDEDEQLDTTERKKIISASRDIRRNFAVAAWAVRCHLDYVSRFSFHSQTGDDELDRTLEDFVKWWARPANCDARGRQGGWSFWDQLRGWEARRVIDGDCVLMKLDNGKIATIEGDRIRTPYGSELPKGASAKEFTHGVRTDKYGGHVTYAVCDRNSLTGYSNCRAVSAKHCEFHSYRDRFDQVRGISPLSSAINLLRDTYESFTYAVAKMKISQLLGLVTKQATSETFGDLSGEDTDGDGVPDDDLKIDLGKGPFHLDVGVDDEVEFVTPDTPGPAFGEFSQRLIQTALRGLDIPYSFFDEAHTTYGGQRQALLQYDRSAEVKRDANRELADRLIRWRLRKAVLNGELDLPRGMTVSDLKWNLQSEGIPWIDPLKEVKADVEAIAAGVASRQEVCKRRGKDFFEIVDELEQEQNLLKEKGLPTEIATGNVTINEVSGDE